MVRHILLLLSSLGLAAAFTVTAPLTNDRRNVSPLYMGGSSGYSTTLDGKKKTVERIKGLLDTSEMIFAIPASAVTVKQSESLRNNMPAGTHVAVIKNKLMARALEDTDYQAASTLLKGANMWFFIENDISSTMTAYKAFTKEFQKQETHAVLGGVMDQIAYDGPGVDIIGSLPSKDTLYAQIAGAIKAVPTKVARVIKAPGDKMARAIKLATDENTK
jgi:large subunit ribosomal protein L10